MALSYETLIFDASGEIFLLLERKPDASTDNPSADAAPTDGALVDGASNDDAPHDDITPAGNETVNNAVVNAALANMVPVDEEALQDVSPMLLQSTISPKPR